MLVIAGVIGVLAILNLIIFKGDYSVSVDIVINKPPADVYTTVVNFRSWEHWNPWLIFEPECLLKYSAEPAVTAVGGHYSWHGEKLSSGKITHLSLNPNKDIVQRLEFIKPFKSVSKVTWQFEETTGGTKVTWGMASSVPFFVRYMTKRITNFITLDYKLGLVRLKQHIDKNAPQMELSFHGVSRQSSIRCVGHDYHGNMAGYKAAGAEHFPKMFEVAKDNSNNNIPGSPLAYINDFQQQAQTIASTLGVPTEYEEVAGYRIFEIPGGLYAKTDLIGEYALLEHAWHASFSSIRMNKLKYDKSRKPYEVYNNGPQAEKDQNKYHTSIYLPVKR